MSGRIVLPLFVDVHTHLDKGHIWRRKRNPAGDFPSALAATIEDRSANWTAADVAARMEFSLRCGLRARRRRPFAPISTASARRRESAGRSSPKRASAGAAGSTLQASPLFTIEFALDASHMADIEAMLDAHGSGILGAATRMVPRPARGARNRSSHSPSARAGSSTSMSTKAPIPRLARSRSSPTWRSSAALRGRILVGHCCSLALQEDDERRRTIDAVARAGLERRLPADVQHVPSGSPGRPHAALARRHRAARTESGRRQRDDRQRQHPRSVLRLWRSRHDGSLARGRADPAPRLSVRRLGAGGLGCPGARRWDWTSAFCVRARAPT